MFYPEKESKKQGKGGGKGRNTFYRKTTRKFSVVVGSFGGGGSGGGITIDDVSHLETTASLGSGQLQTCLYNPPGYQTNHQTLLLLGESGGSLASKKDFTADW